MFSQAATIKEIKLAIFLIGTFVIAPLMINDELRYNKGKNITHLAHFSVLFSVQPESTNLKQFSAIKLPSFF